MKKVYLFGVVTMLGLLAGVSGCGNPKGDPVKSEEKPSKKTGEEDHSHGTGPHGGTVADWGGGKYHVEFCMDHKKKEATVYLLKGDATTPAPIKTDKLLLSIKEPSFQIDLKAMPQKGDPKDSSSRFVGNHANFGKEQEFAGTISGEVGGKPYAGDFKEEEPKDAKK